MTHTYDSTSLYRSTMTDLHAQWARADRLGVLAGDLPKRRDRVGSRTVRWALVLAAALAVASAVASDRVVVAVRAESLASAAAQHGRAGRLPEPGLAGGWYRRVHTELVKIAVPIRMR